MSEVYDADGVVQPDYARPIIEFLETFWTVGFAELDGILAERQTAPNPRRPAE